jgi:hypothetical protein
MQPKIALSALLVLSFGNLTALASAALARSDEPAAEESVSSWPPDTTPYARPAIPEDTNPLRTGTVLPSPEAGAVLSPPIVSGVGIVDPVVNNTDPTLTETDTFNDGETSIAVNPADPSRIVITAFSETWGETAPLWLSTNGGNTWTKKFTINAPPGAPGAELVGCPCDQTVDYGRGGRLSGTFLAEADNGESNVYSSTTLRPTIPAFNWFEDPPGTAQTTNNNVPSSFGFVDQPWLLVNRDPIAPLRDIVYVAYDDFSGSEVALRVAVAAGTKSPDFTLDNLTGISVGAVNPGLRLAVDKSTGAVYSLYQFNLPGPKNIFYVLNRSTDGGQTWSLNGDSLGVVVANANSTQPTPKFCTVNALLGGVLHGAVDPTSGDIFYVYGSRDPDTGNNRLALRQISDDGAGGVMIGDEIFVTGQVQAAIPSVAIAKDGTIGVFYYTCDGFSGGFPVFTAHLSLSRDLGQTFTDIGLLTFLSPAADNGDRRQRVLGDYMQMKALGNTFYGAFTGNGVAFGRPFANNDPIFFRVSLQTRSGVASN